MLKEKYVLLILNSYLSTTITVHYIILPVQYKIYIILRFLRFTFYVASTELPLFVDVAYCYDVCTDWDEGVQLPNMAATQTNGTKWVGARLLCLVTTGTIL